MLKIMIVSGAMLVMGAPAWAAPEQVTENQATVALHQLIKIPWQREMRKHPLEASADGFHEYGGN